MPPPRVPQNPAKRQAQHLPVRATGLCKRRVARRSCENRPPHWALSHSFTEAQILPPEASAEGRSRPCPADVKTAALKDRRFHTTNHLSKPQFVTISGPITAFGSAVEIAGT